MSSPLNKAIRAWADATHRSAFAAVMGQVIEAIGDVHRPVDDYGQDGDRDSDAITAAAVSLGDQAPPEDLWRTLKKYRRRCLKSAAGAVEASAEDTRADDEYARLFEQRFNDVATQFANTNLARIQELENELAQVRAQTASLEEMLQSKKVSERRLKARARWRSQTAALEDFAEKLAEAEEAKVEIQQRMAGIRARYGEGNRLSVFTDEEYKGATKILKDINAMAELGVN